MKILQLDLGREWRGGQRQVLYLMRHLRATEGFSTVLAAPRGCPLALRAAAMGLRVRELAGRFEWDPRSIFSLRALIVRERIDIIHTHCARSASLGAVLQRLTGAGLVHSRRVSYPLKYGWSRSKYLAADVVACVSREIAVVAAMGGVSEDRLTVIHSGIDPLQYSEAAATPPPDADRPVFAVIGALTRQKGHGVFLDALAELGRRRPDLDWRAIIAGDGALMSDLRAQADRLGIAARVEFAGYRESVQVLAGTSILAVPSVDGEGSSAAIKEGWAANRPVVCSDLPSNLELVVSGENGLACTRDNPSALADSFERLLGPQGAGTPSLVETLVRGGRESLAQFTDTAMARSYMNLYTSLVS